MSNGCGFITTTTTTTTPPMHMNINLKSRFPRLQECAHFHYEVNTVDIPKNFKVSLCNYDNGGESASQTDECSPTYNVLKHASTTNCSTSSPASQQSADATNWFYLQITSNDKKWIIKRSYENFSYLDKYLHDCIFDRKFSNLKEPQPPAETNKSSTTALYKSLSSLIYQYLTRFCEIAFINPINCGPILNWFEVCC